MNKVLKKLLIAFAVLVLCVAAFLVSWVYLIFPKLQNSDLYRSTDPSARIETIAEENEQIDFNESSGLLYVNNEIVVVAAADAGSGDMNALAAEQGATIDDTMADIGIYKFTYPARMSYKKLESTITEIKENLSVADAYFNTVSPLEADAVDEDFDYRSPVYPKDDWSGDAWNTSVPSGENWGMEAINAPGAWGYLDQMSNVRIGLIDTMPYSSHPDLSFANTSCLFVDTETGSTSTNTYTISAADHGTHVSGIMGAEWNNDIGVAGVTGGKGSLYYSAVYYDTNGSISSRYGTAYSYLLALKTLIDQDVQVINISQNTSRLVGFAASHGNQNAIDYLTRQAELTEAGLLRIIAARKAAGKGDFVICVAAGNSNSTYYYKDEDAPYGYREDATAGESIKYVFGWRGEIGNSLALYNNFLNLMSASEVKDRVIVVGSVGIDYDRSTSAQTKYSYSAFSNVGDRVDVVAPGEHVYSCTASGYASLSGTSMATPHVAGVAGLVFACNPDLSGPDVKNILLASTAGRFYYYNGYSGMIDANMAVVNALQTRNNSVGKVLHTSASNGLDLCFVVDTTGSMGDDIDNAKENMSEILLHLSEKTSDYRVALVDYRDFSSRTGRSYDYPSQIQLRFTSDNEAIESAINGLDLGHGGDTEETVYSGLMAAVGLDWRPNAKKVIIILGDAAPLDPEPETGYTFDDVLNALINAEISLDYDHSDRRVAGAMDGSLITVYSIGTDASSDAADFFENISTETGGSYSGVSDASEVGDAIIDSIEQIEIIPTVSVRADFGDSLKEKTIDIYRDDAYLFSIKTDDEGAFQLDSMEAATYDWRCPETMVGGSIKVKEDGRSASVETTQQHWFTPILSKWEQHKAMFILFSVLIVLFFLLVPPTIAKAAGKPATAKKVKPTEPQFVFCTHCGAKLPHDAKFCDHCGAKVDP